MPKETQETIGRYHYSAVAHMAALRYLYGMASNRLEDLSSNTGLKVSDSTQWSLFEEAASRLLQFIFFLKTQAANSPVCHVDDTHLTILAIARAIEEDQMAALKAGKNPAQVRSGIHTTNITAVFPQGQIVLFSSGLHHAGEAIVAILKKRTVEEQVVLMVDAASANTSKLKEISADVKVANCNSHAVRKFKELEKSEQETAKKLLLADHKTSEEVDFFLRGYKRIFENESKTKVMSSSERLEYHRNSSLPIMESMRERINKTFNNKRIEPNSDVGKQYSYLLNHWKELTAFCCIENAPVCNNLSERMLKSAIRHRKNSLFFKNQLGAMVGDVFTSILMTARANGLNPIEYIQNLLTYQDCWLQKPEDWLPWNYAATIENLTKQD